MGEGFPVRSHQAERCSVRRVFRVCVPASGQPHGGPSNMPHQAGAAPWWQSLPSVQPPAAIPPAQQPLAIPSVQQPAGVPLALQHPRFGPQQQPELVQQRARLPIGGAAAASDQNPSSAAIPPSGPIGLWRVSNTGRALQELLTQVNRVFQRPAGGAGWKNGGLEVVVPVANVTNALIELSKLIPAVISFCEAELTEQRSRGEFGQMGQSISHNYGVASNFPVEAFIKQGSEYSRRVTDQLCAMRDLLSAVLAPSANRASILREVQRFNAVMADGKEVYQLGSQMSSAAAGAVLPYLSTCSFFSKGDPRGAYKHWSLVGARISSTLRYLYQALEVVRKVSGRLGDLVSGKIQPQSLQDFARSKPFFRAAAYLETAEARSVSAVSYFNELAAAYNSHTRSATFNPVGQSHEERGAYSSPQRPGDDQDSVGVGELNAEMSLMAEDLVPEVAISRRGLPSTYFHFGEFGSVQTAIEPAAEPSANPKPLGGYEVEAEDEDMMQTVGSD